MPSGKKKWTFGDVLKKKKTSKKRSIVAEPPQQQQAPPPKWNLGMPTKKRSSKKKPLIGVGRTSSKKKPVIVGSQPPLVEAMSHEDAVDTVVCGYIYLVNGVDPISEAVVAPLLEIVAKNKITMGELEEVAHKMIERQRQTLGTDFAMPPSIRVVLECPGLAEVPVGLLKYAPTANPKRDDTDIHGANGSYWFRDRNDAPAGIFKPDRMELFAELHPTSKPPPAAGSMITAGVNPHWDIFPQRCAAADAFGQREIDEDTVRECFTERRWGQCIGHRVGDASVKEALVSWLDPVNFAGVPPVALAELTVPTHGRLKGSFQSFAPCIGSFMGRDAGFLKKDQETLARIANEKGQVPLFEFQKLAAFKVRIGLADQWEALISPNLKLRPIDHGYSFLDGLAVFGINDVETDSVWNDPFTDILGKPWIPQIRDWIRSWDGEKDEARLRKRLVDNAINPDRFASSFREMKLRTTYIQKAVGREFTPEQVARLVCRFKGVAKLFDVSASENRAFLDQIYYDVREKAMPQKKKGIFGGKTKSMLDWPSFAPLFSNEVDRRLMSIMGLLGVRTQTPLPRKNR